MNDFSSDNLTCTNVEIRFIKGFFFKPQSHVYDIDIYGTHQRTASNWHKIDYSKVETKDGIFFHFSHPVNFFQFKITAHGFFLRYEDFSYIYFSPLNMAQAVGLLKEKRVAILGCARNCASALEAALGALTKVGELFQDYQINVVENDSDDRTPEILGNFKKANAKFDFFSLGNLETSIRNRIQRLSYCRNFLLDKCRFDRLDYVIVADLDGIVGRELTVESFISNFQFHECWGGCFPINNGFYYDLYAFRNAEIAPMNPMKKLNQIEAVWGEKNAHVLTIEPLHRARFDALKGWLEVDSAFGGMAIYRADIIKSARYSPIDHGLEECEHVVFHQAIKRQSNTRFFINPQFVVNGLHTERS